MLELFPHQKEDSLWMSQTKRCINGSQMGVGKSACTIQAVKNLKSTRNLIICPASLKKNWQNELFMWYPDAPTFVLSGPPKQRQATLDEFSKYSGFLITNYEQIAPRKSGGKYVSTFEFDAIRSFKMQTMIVDEAHMLRNRKTQMYKGAFELSKGIPNLFLLTGTPFMNRFGDMWTLAHMINPAKYSAYWAGWIDHPVWGCGHVVNRYGGYEPNQRSKNPEAFKREIEPFFRRRLKEDVLKDLPEKTYQRLWVDLFPEEKRVYDQMEADWLATLKALEYKNEKGESEGEENKTVAAPVIIAQITRLKQFCISPDLAIMPVEKNVKLGHGYNTAKFRALLELLQSTDQKFVVFSQFERAITLGMMMCAKHGIKAVRHTGVENERAKNEAIQTFKEDEDCQVIFLTIRSGGLGLNLTESSNCVFLDRDWVPAMNEQAAARIHRPGQKHKCVIYEILVENSIESWLVEEKLKGKSDMIKEIIRQSEENRTERRYKVAA